MSLTFIPSTNYTYQILNLDYYTSIHVFTDTYIYIYMYLLALHKRRKKFQVWTV